MTEKAMENLKRKSQNINRDIPPQIRPLGGKSGSKNPSFVPKATTRTLTLVDFTQSTASGLTVYTYRLNSLYDPDETGTGNQPLGFDELMALYGNYRVESVKVTVEAVNGGTVALVAAAPSTSSTDFSDITSVASSPGAKSQLLSGAAGDNYCKFTFKVSIKKFLGMGFIDRDLMGSSTSNPLRQVYFHIGMQEYDASAKGITLSVKIEFTSRFLTINQFEVS
jgi:hypothetical protein